MYYYLISTDLRDLNETSDIIIDKFFKLGW